MTAKIIDFIKAKTFPKPLPELTIAQAEDLQRVLLQMLADTNISEIKLLHALDELKTHRANLQRHYLTAQRVIQGAKP